MNALLILGNQLFSNDILKAKLKEKIDYVYMREDRELCTYEKFHKVKIAFFLASMRNHAQELKTNFEVKYEKLGENPKLKYEESLLSFLKSKKIQKLFYFEIEDKFFESRIKKIADKNDIELVELTSPLFLTDRKELQALLTSGKKPFMKSFYEKRRKDLKILLTKEGQPVGGKWSFDTENRKPLPKTVKIPSLIKFEQNKNVKDVLKLVNDEFSYHPGELSEFWLPTTRAESLKFLNQFVKERLDLFGPYEDALTDRSDFVFHSGISPILNVGLITPDEVIRKALLSAKEFKISLASLEGFIRQVIGWREFVRGIYQNYSEKQAKLNFFGHTKKLSPLWYEGGTGVPPLDQAIQKVNRLAYNHHIERLMVIGNLMTLLEVEPKAAYRWFMEMYVDSSDWVMGPNVYGMALFSDGGIFATKPYICGSNFYRKMGNFPKGDWCDEVDGLYWEFVDRNRSFLSKNPRTMMMVKNLDRMDKSRRKTLTIAAEKIRKRLTL